MGLFSRLNTFVKENIREPFTNYLYDLGVRTGLNAGMNEQEIESSLTNRIFDAVTRPLSQVMQRIQDDTDTFNYYSRLDTSEIPDIRNMRKAEWISADIGYVVEYDVYDIKGDYVGNQRARFDTDKILTQDELMSHIEDSMYSKSGVEVSMMQNIRVIGAMRRK